MLKTKFSRLWNDTLNKAEQFGGFQLYMLALMVIMFLAYDSQVLRLGFYYDDWEGVFLYKLSLPFSQIWDYFLIDRPFSALVHALFNPFVGASSMGWHLLALMLNWAAILFFVKTMLGIWPKQVLSIGWMGLLFSVYPGITRQFVPLTSIPHYSSMFLFTLSLWLMVLAYKDPRRRMWYLIASILLGCVQTLLIEFFAGLELIRFFLLFYLVWGEDGKFWNSLKRTVLHWLPYLTIFITFIAYKFFVLPVLQFKGSTPKHSLIFFQQFAANPLATIVSYANMILQDLAQGIIFVWTLAITPIDIEIQAKVYLTSWLLGAFMGLLAFIVMEAWARKVNPDESRASSTPYLFVVVFLAILLGGLPGWIIGRQAVRGIWSSRFLFGQVFGIVPLVVICLLWLVGPKRRALQQFILALLLVGSFSLQFRTGNNYARDWDYQRNFFWQLKWRIPGLTPQAFIVAPSSATQLTVDYQMAFAVNILYASGYAKTEMPYWWFNGPEELRSVKDSEPNSQRFVGRTFRTISFGSGMEKAVPVLSSFSRGCLLVADPVYKYAPLLSDNEKLMFLTSHPEMILAKETSPMPTDVFGSEPAHTWCYIFLKADLARQHQQWDEVHTLWSKALAQDYRPNYGPEYLPFMEAFARSGKWLQALQLTKQANEQTEEMQPFLCDNWLRFISETRASPKRDAAWEQVKGLLACSG